MRLVRHAKQECHHSKEKLKKAREHAEVEREEKKLIAARKAKE